MRSRLRLFLVAEQKTLQFAAGGFGELLGEFHFPRIGVGGEAAFYVLF
jgi:hypothetical protein